jgi:hypothetical protein
MNFAAAPRRRGIETKPQAGRLTARGCYRTRLVMLNDDFLVNPLSDLDVRENANRLRRFLGWADAERIDVIALEHVTEIWTVQGVKPIRMEVVADADLPSDSGRTSYDGAGLLVQIPRHIRYQAFMGDGFLPMPGRPLRCFRGDARPDRWRASQAGGDAVRPCDAVPDPHGPSPKRRQLNTDEIIRR